jgi:phage terminase large subunit-like protein
MSLEQASLVFDVMGKMIKLNVTLDSALKLQDTRRSIACPELGTVYKALSAEDTTAHGLAPSVVVFDELAQAGLHSKLYDVMQAGAVALPDPLTIIISTQAAGNDDLLSVLIDDAKAKVDQRTVLALYETPADHPEPFSEAAIRLANPGFDIFQNKEELLAQRLPAYANSFRNLNLNQRIESGAAFMSRAVWEACNGAPRDMHGVTCFAGLDLSSTTDYTAIALVTLDTATAQWGIKPYFWLPAEEVEERSRTDQLPYPGWVAKGYLELVPGPAISYEFIAQRLREIFREHHIKALAYDPWNFIHLRPYLVAAGFTERELGEKFIPFPQTYEKMSPAIRNFETLALERKLRHGGHRALAECVSSAVVTMDSSGNRKLNKQKSRRRIDGAIETIMALAAAPTAWTRPFDVSTLIG